MSTAEIPEKWARRIMQRGYVRTRGSGPNLSAFAADIGVHTSTLTNALRGGVRAPAPATIAKIVAALGPDTAAWFGLERVEPWEPPESAALLTARQRKALAELIDAMTEGGEGHVCSAPKSRAAGSAARKSTTRAEVFRGPSKSASPQRQSEDPGSGRA